MKLKDKKIELLRQVHTRDEIGITKTILESMGTVQAYFRHLSGKEVFAAATVNYKEEVLFQTNYRTDLTTANMVRYNEMLHNITCIDTFEGYKSVSCPRFLTCLAQSCRSYSSALKMEVSLPEESATSCVPMTWDPVRFVFPPAVICTASPERVEAVTVLLSSQLLIVVVLQERRLRSLYFRPQSSAASL